MKNCLLKILLVEDDRSDAELVRMSLSSATNFHADMAWAKSVSAARGILHGGQFDLILSDLDLPDGGGIESLERIRSRVAEGVPIIALTDRDRHGMAIEAIRAGASDFFPKNELGNRDAFHRTIMFAMERFAMKREMAEINSQLEKQNQSLAQQNEISQQFVDNVSHEFRTPLTVVRELTSLLRDEIEGPINEQQRRRLNTILYRTDDLARMVDDLLDTSRIESGMVKCCRKTHKLEQIIRRVVSLLEPRANQKSIHLDASQSFRGIEVFCDDEKLSRIIINLVNNAIKFTPVGGNIHIDVGFNTDHMVTISVADDGPGIGEADLKLIFDRFLQLEHHSRMASCKGFGLGLSIARSLSYLNLGSLHVESCEGEGSQFSVKVPVATRDSIVAAYLNSQINTDSGDDVTIIKVTPIAFNRCKHIEAIEEIDDFVRSSFKNCDLVFQTDESEWTVLAKSDTREFIQLREHILSEWEMLRRNSFSGDLPQIVLEEIFTGKVSQDSYTLHQTLRHRKQEKRPVVVCASQGSQRKILVVDDDHEVADAVSARLTANGYKVRTASDGIQGLNAIRNDKPDAILLDVRMPNLDGIELLKQIKCDPGSSDIPIVVLSASLRDQNSVLDNGANYFLPKPFQSHNILSALEASLGPAPNSNLPKLD